MKRSICLLLAAVLLPAASEERPVPDSKAWRKSSAANTAAVRQFKPAWQGNAVVAGNKKAVFGEDGIIRIWTGGRPVLNIFGYYRVKTRRKEAYWAGPDSKEIKRTTTHDGKTLTTCGDLTIEGKTWRAFTQKAELTPEGLIRVTLNWQHPAPELNWSFSPTLTLTGSYENLGGTLVTINEEQLRLPAVFEPKAPEKLGEFWRGRYSRITFLADRPEDAFVLYGLRRDNVPGLWAFRSQAERNLRFKVYVDKKKPGVTFFIDIRSGVGIDSDPTAIRAGINFKNLENLEMPDKAGRNLYFNGSFEKGISGWMIGIRTHGIKFYGKKKWDDPIFQLDDKVGKFGTSSLRIKTRYKQEEKENVHYSSIQGFITGPYTVIEPGTYTVSWYAKGDNPEHQLLNFWAPNFMVGNSYAPRPGGKKQCRLSREWQRYSFTLNVPQTDCFNLRLNATSSDQKGFVWVDGIQLEKGGKPTEFDAPAAEGRLFTSEPQNFIDASQPINAKLRVTAAPGARGKVKISLKNFFGEKIFEQEYAYAADTSGKAEIELPFISDAIGKGLFVLRAEYHPGKGAAHYEHHRFTVLDYIPGKFKHRHIFTDSYESWHCNERFYSLLDRWQKIGYGSMGQNESYTRDKEVIDLYRKHNMELITFYPECVNRWWDKVAGPRKTGHWIAIANGRHDPNRKNLLADFNQECNGKLTDEYLKRYEDGMAKVAAAQPWINRWCMRSEVSARYPLDWWGDGTTPDKFAQMHAKLLKAFAAGVRRGNPKAVVIQGGPANMAPSSGIAEVDRLLTYTGKEGVRFDMIGFHPYRFSPELPDLDSDTQKAFDMIKRHGYGKETKLAWDEMMNWGPYELPPFGTKRSTWNLPPRTWFMSSLSYDMGWTEKQSASWRVRSWLVALKYGDRIDSCCSGSTNNFNMDIHLTPFATQISPNVLANLLGNSTFLADVRFAPFMRVYIFDDGTGRPVAAVWCHQDQVDSGAADAPRVQADFGDTLEGVFDMMNTRRKFTPGKMTFPVNGYPLFFRGKKGTAKAMIDAWRKAVVISGKDMNPIFASAKAVSADKYQITLKSFISLPIEGTMNGVPFKLEPAGSCSQEFKFPQALTGNKLASVALPLTVKTKAGSTYRYDLSFDAMTAGRIPAGSRLENVDWSRIPSVPITRHWKDGKTSGSFRLGWNVSGLFLEVTVKDAKFVHQEFAKTHLRYANDCLQVYFDTMANARTRPVNVYDEDDYEYAVVPNSKGDSSIVFRYRSVDQQLGLGTMAPRDNTVAKDIPSTFTRTADGYVYRVFFPAKYLLPIRLEKGHVFGFGLFAPDCGDDSLQGDKRMEGALTLATDGQGCFNRPKVWPAVLLTE